ncbi:hypothetical protein [Geobacter sp. AOG1]|uniref:hypothetical protein n=1 Tax=Geobacter sp. AOG1 TaxID=1566346 RepID=UPI001CC3EE4A|nr:hypothetical protein [Geobacter sp. AOG1]GFE56408.1 hypothetical protein AOG1_02870 [Geobacter sp. AOG1]
MQTIQRYGMALKSIGDTMERAHLLLGALSDRCGSSAVMFSELSGQGIDMKPEQSLEVSELLYELGHTLGFVSESLETQKDRLCRCLESSK